MQTGQVFFQGVVTYYVIVLSSVLHDFINRPPHYEIGSLINVMCLQFLLLFYYCTTDTRVGVEYGTIIMRCRNEKGWTQRDLAQVLYYTRLCMYLFK